MVTLTIPGYQAEMPSHPAMRIDTDYQNKASTTLLDYKDS
ncbi:hypothetical protein COLO4_29743 [Corchorus olitorius]|uniref:Uncharacterized protein n=1 Tax=Corchorus olitorius TaxID=93759 RepID=A0A1R3HDJ9_9ROSI|nr:hypothetical protein COLO4_29743 [Corchorus olitorius]